MVQLYVGLVVVPFIIILLLVQTIRFIFFYDMHSAVMPGTYRTLASLGEVLSQFTVVCAVCL
jgi:hypothetical protein